MSKLLKALYWRYGITETCLSIDIATSFKGQVGDKINIPMFLTDEECWFLAYRELPSVFFSAKMIYEQLRSFFMTREEYVGYHKMRRSIE